MTAKPGFSSSRILFATLVVAAVIGILSARPAAGDVPPQLIKYADLVLFNGQVLTVDAEFTVARRSPFAMAGCWLSETRTPMLALAGPETERVDLEGRSVTPGYIYNDGDNAVPGGDIYKDTMVGGELSGRILGASLTELLASIESVLAKAVPGEPVFVNMPKAHSASGGAMGCQ